MSSAQQPLSSLQSQTPSDEEQRLRIAMEECDNPFILPLFDFAIETTARRGSLFKLEWCDVDFERRYAMLYDREGGHDVTVPLTLRAMDILKRLPRDAAMQRSSRSPSAPRKALGRVPVNGLASKICISTMVATSVQLNTQNACAARTLMRHQAHQ